jgi:hypothetical protein
MVKRKIFSLLFFFILLNLVSAYHPGTTTQQTSTVMVANYGSGPLIAIIIFIAIIIGWIYWNFKNGKS